MKTLKVNKAEAVLAIQEWADDAENGNLHDLCAMLSKLAVEVAAHKQMPLRIWVIKDLDPWDDNAIVDLEITIMRPNPQT